MFNSWVWACSQWGVTQQHWSGSPKRNFYNWSTTIGTRPWTTEAPPTPAPTPTPAPIPSGNTTIGQADSNKSSSNGNKTSIQPFNSSIVLILNSIWFSTPSRPQHTNGFVVASIISSRNTRLKSIEFLFFKQFSNRNLPYGKNLFETKCLPTGCCRYFKLNLPSIIFSTAWSIWIRAKDFY